MSEKRYRVEPEKQDISIQNIVDSINKGYELQKMTDDEAETKRLEFVNAIILKPDYQREYRSSPEEESSLIESVLLGIPIPPVFLCTSRLRNVKVVNVVDGQHRLYAFYRYRNDLFSLKDLPLLSEYNGKRFSELQPDDQEMIVSHTLSSYVFTNFPGKKFELEVFNRYNKGTKNLTPQEIRNAVYASPHNEYVTEFLNKLYTLQNTGESTANDNNVRLANIYNVTKDRYLKKKVHEGIFTILYVLENGIRSDFKDSTTYANEFMKNKSQMAELVEAEDEDKRISEEELNADLTKVIDYFTQFNSWIIECSDLTATPYPISREFYGISSKSYKFQTSMALILPAIFRKVFITKETPQMENVELVNAIKECLVNSFIEDPDYTASSTNSREIDILVTKFPIPTRVSRWNEEYLNKS